MIVLGIDPGLDGAIAAIGDAHFIIDIPTKPDEEYGRRVDGVQLAQLLREHLNGGMRIKVCIEALSAGGQDKGRNQFKTVGSQFWTQSAIVTTLELLGLRLDHSVYPQTWKPFYNLGGKTAGDKALTTRKARELVADLYPGLADYVQFQKNHNRAEAVLIAHWYDRVHG